MIQIYCDGACRGNGKAHAVGAYAFVVIGNGKQLHEVAKAEAGVTNNIMELKGCILALEYCQLHHAHEMIKVYCDSKYVVNGMNDWSKKWVKQNWQRWVDDVGYEPIKNKELWQHLLSIKSWFSEGVYFEWVRGHAGNIFNERCDLLCNQTLDTFQHNVTKAIN